MIITHKGYFYVASYLLYLVNNSLLKHNYVLIPICMKCVHILLPGYPDIPKHSWNRRDNVQKNIELFILDGSAKYYSLFTSMQLYEVAMRPQLAVKHKLTDKVTPQRIFALITNSNTAQKF